MEAIEFEGVDVRLAENQPEYQTLPAQRVNIPIGNVPGQTVEGLLCCFQLTPEEIADVVTNGKIWHTSITCGGPLQPLLMTTDKPVFP